MNVVIFSKLLKETDEPHVQRLFDALYQCQITPFIFEPYFRQIEGKIKLTGTYQIFKGYQDLGRHKIDAFITLGGDGTILKAVTLIRENEIPILGINLGRLGFLASIEKKLIEESMEQLQRGMYRIEERSMLFLESNYPLFDKIPFALNDFTLSKRDTSSMITIHTHINGAYLNSFWADGIIISTPTGSTGYSLSCGGPIVFPGSGNFVITPVAPHNLNVRPIVVSDDSVISFEIEGRAANFLCTLDSRYETITATHNLAVKKNAFKARLIQPNDQSFLDTIRQKLTWGIDTRNH